MLVKNITDEKTNYNEMEFHQNIGDKVQGHLGGDRMALSDICTTRQCDKTNGQVRPLQ